MSEAALRVAYQGERGAFSEAAAHRLLGSNIDGVPLPTFEALFEAIESGSADCCIAPIENSLFGSIHRNYDLLMESGLRIIAETHLRIVHNLIAAPGTQRSDVRRVYSHPVALGQCMRFFGAHPELEAIPLHDTAGSVRLVLERGRRDEAAIASETAAGLYGGTILERGLEDHAQNFTRFFLLAGETSATTIATIEETRRWKTSLILRVANKPGALFRALGVFALQEIDLSKIESRPIEGRPWEYAFYLDLVGRDSDPLLARALSNLSDMAELVQILGSYPTRW